MGVLFALGAMLLGEAGVEAGPPGPPGPSPGAQAPCAVLPPHDFLLVPEYFNSWSTVSGDGAYRYRSRYAVYSPSCNSFVAAFHLFYKSNTDGYYPQIQSPGVMLDACYADD